MKKKKCIRCKRTRSSFYKNKTKKDGYDDHCKSCRNEVGRSYRVAYYKAHRTGRIAQYRMANRDRHAVYRLNRSGCSISLDEYRSLRRAHSGLCDVCREPSVTRLAADHDHVTGKFRGFLCRGCNTGLGNFKDSVGILQSAIRYLNEV